MNILVFAPHPDDEILGVGGTIAKKVRQGHQVYVCVVTKGCEPLFSVESVEKVRTECVAADSFLGVTETIFLDFPAVRLEEVERYKLNNSITELIQNITPQEVYIPHRGDMQLDHKIIVDASMVALRPKYNHTVNSIYAYETLSETGWDIPNVSNEFIPTVYEDIGDTIEMKLKAMKFYKSQLAPFPAARSIEAVEALARYRGAMVNKAAAEAFSLIREVK